MDYYDVPTTCTAKQIAEWDLQGREDHNENPLLFARYNLKIVNALIAKGFLEDFALIFAIVTHDQMTDYHLEPFFEKIGFTKAFVGEKEKGRGQRHMETGHLYMWCTTPDVYARSLEAYKKELTDEINALDRRRIDPERQKVPDLLLQYVRKAGLVRDNARVANRISAILMPGVTAEQVAFFIKNGYGLDVVATFGNNWTDRNFQLIKEAQVKWKQELVPY